MGTGPSRRALPRTKRAVGRARACCAPPQRVAVGAGTAGHVAVTRPMPGTAGHRRTPLAPPNPFSATTDRCNRASVGSLSDRTGGMSRRGESVSRRPSRPRQGTGRSHGDFVKATHGGPGANPPISPRTGSRSRHKGVGRRASGAVPAAAGSTFGVVRRKVRQDQCVATTHEIPIAGKTIRLGQLLKLSGIAESGGASKALLVDGVRVNGVSENRRGRQLHHGDVVEARGECVRVVAA
jgi:ribosome-associated protein